MKQYTSEWAEAYPSLSCLRVVSENRLLCVLTIHGGAHVRGVKFQELVGPGAKARVGVTRLEGGKGRVGRGGGGDVLICCLSLSFDH